MQKFFIALFTTLLIGASLNAQLAMPYTYSQLSGQFYQSQKNELKKAAIAKDIFSDKKTQKKYVELHEGRRANIASGFDRNDYVYQPEINTYLAEIISSLQKNNKAQIPTMPLVLLDRSDVVNAYALGDNIIVVNTGLVLFCQHREELALILAHELAHNALQHSEKSIRESATWLSSDEYKETVESVLDSKYERYSRLKKIFTGYSFNRSRHSRYHESDADSLAIVFLKNAGIGFDARFFLRLDSVQHPAHVDIKKPVKHFFDSHQLEYDNNWTKPASRGLSGRNYQFKDTSAVNQEDSVKTHPDCLIRYEQTKHLSQTAQLSKIPDQVKQLGKKIITWNKIAGMELTQGLYHIVQQQESSENDKWYDLMAYTVFSALSYADKDLKRFNAAGAVPKELVATGYYELQTILTKMSRLQLEKINATLQTAMRAHNWGKEEKELLQALSLLNQQTTGSSKNIAAIQKQVFQSSPDNPYNELLNTLLKN